uniref:Uncharacterized protein n=1 Tax=Pyxicephalus adspersus TaxID=30357 RepID=A0AAV3AGV5_PYXAD|nr:TPA: hypothetical protein GDO54_010507 [Pyxicephalus adspersus]
MPYSLLLNRRITTRIVLFFGNILNLVSMLITDQNSRFFDKQSDNSRLLWKGSCALILLPEFRLLGWVVKRWGLYFFVLDIYFLGI